jgi:hypothetical protein
VEYVMVPVPEELADKVLTYVRWKEAQASGTVPAGERQDQGDAMARAFARLDESGRAMVTVIAAAMLEGDGLSVPEAARRTGVSAREAVAILLEVNNVMASEGGPPLGLGGTELGASAGASLWDSHTVTMDETIAGTVVDLARSHVPA